MRTTTKQRASEAKKLRKLPAVAAKAVVAVSKRARTPKKVVESVQEELARLLARGYSVEEVGAVLRGAGIDISAATLRSYARAASKSGETASAAPAGAKRKVATRKAAAASRSSSAGAVPAPARKLATPPAAPAKGRAAAAKSAASPAPRLRDFQMAKATFVVRPDTPDSDL